MNYVLKLKAGRAGFPGPYYTEAGGAMGWGKLSVAVRFDSRAKADKAKKAVEQRIPRAIEVVPVKKGKKEKGNLRDILREKIDAIGGHLDRFCNASKYYRCKPFSYRPATGELHDSEGLVARLTKKGRKQVRMTVQGIGQAAEFVVGDCIVTGPADAEKKLLRITQEGWQ